MYGDFQKRGVTYQSGAYDKSRRKQSLTSGLEILTWRLRIQKDWIIFCLGGKNQ